MNNKYTFKDLLDNEIVIDEEQKTTIRFNKIEIPMIQRDYAQGRGKKINNQLQLNETGKRFIDKIFEALTEGKFMEMDFVYGSVSTLTEEEKTIENVFIPLDGQQRLTTLFLLHWYTGSRELTEGEEYNYLRQLLKKFTYSTRTSSRRFCEQLCETHLTFQHLPSQEIRNLFWFFNAYRKDPTIKAMLNMLDYMHTKYSEIENPALYSNLDKLQFYILPLDGFNLTEDLYIKMNARGKQLTHFENFKADLIKWMKDDTNPEKEKFSEEVVYHTHKMPYYMAIAQMLDNEWTNFFWEITKHYNPEEKDEQGDLLHPQGKITDPLFMTFFYRYFLNQVIIQSGKKAEQIEQLPDFAYFYGNQGDDSTTDYTSFIPFQPYFSYELIHKMELFFKVLSAHTEIIKENISPAWSNRDWMFYNKTITQRQRLAFYATTLFLEKPETFDSKKYTDWMRFVWNIIVDPNIRSVPAMINAMKFIKDISAHASDILSFLAKTEQEATQFKVQFKEEQIKAKLIIDPEGNERAAYKKEILEAESHLLFKGNIRFLLTEEENTPFDSFHKNRQAAFRVFEKYKPNAPENYLWIRATLAKGTGMIPLPITLSNGSFDNWRYLINSSLMEPFRALLNEVGQDMVTDVNEVMENICSSYQRDEAQDWVYPLVSWKGKNGETLLDNYSQSRTVKEYFWKRSQVYLYNKTIWTESNLMLSSFRNELCISLLNKYGLIHDWAWGNIQNNYFRGSTVKIYKDIEGCRITFLLDPQYVRVGIREDDRNEKNEIIPVAEEDKASGWVYRKKYDYMEEVKSIEDIDRLILKIDDDIFNPDNPISLTSKLKVKN